MSATAARTSVLLVFLAPVALAFGDVTLHGSVPLNSASGPATHLTPVDLDGDGRLDLVQSMPTVSLWRQVEGGRLTPVASIASGGTAVVADLDGDGQLSILTLAAGTVRASEFVAPFVLGPQVVLSGPGEVGGEIFAATGDLDGDGHPDLLADRLGQLRVWLGDGTGGLLPSVPAGGVVSTWTELGDLDLDGRLDLLAAQADTPSVTPLLGQGDGTFVAQTPIPLSSPAHDVALGNIDGDGLPDAAVGLIFGTQVLLGTGGGNFAAGLKTTTLGSVKAIDLGDADGDGDDDLVELRSNPASATVSILDAAGVAASRSFETSSSDVAFARLDGNATKLLLSSNNGAHGRVTVIDCGPDGLPEVETQLLDFVHPLALADLDGDGHVELVVWHAVGLQVTVHDIPGDGTMGPQGPLTSVGAGVDSARVLDLDGDNRDDLLLHGLSGLNNQWRPWRSNGDGTFTQGPTITSPGFAASDALGDLDGDGDLDLLVVSTSGVAWYANQHDGSFGPATPISISGLTSTPNFALADADGDGFADLFQGSEAGVAQIRTWKGLGGGSFGPPQVLSSDPVGTTLLRAEDLDGDGHVDLVAVGAADQSPTALAAVTVLHGHGDGSFEPARHYATGLQDQSTFDLLWTADFDGDGRRDVLTQGLLFPQAADGSFGGPRALPLLIGSKQKDFFAVDMDSDGDLDILADGLYSGGLLAATLRVAWVTIDDGALDLGHAKPGAAGEPVLTGGGTLKPGKEAFFQLDAAPASTPLLLVVGLQTADLPLGGGTLVPAPELVLGGFTSDASGSFSLEARWPSDAPPDLTIYAQIWCTDPVTGQSVASNALQFEGD